MSRFLTRTLRDLRQRAAHERLLLFEGNKSMTFSGAVYTHFSCIIKANNQNGNFIGSQTISSLSIPNGEQRLIVGSSSALDIANNGDENYEICNLVLYDRQPTQGEIILIRTQGGVIPESLRPNVKHHWPLTQNYYFQADAAFLLKHTQFSINDNVAIDVVDQYNNGNNPIHATLLNYSVSELGIDDPANQSAIIDVFSQQTSRPQGLFFPDITGNRRVEIRETGTTIDTPGKDFAVFIEFYKHAALSGDNEFFSLFNDNGGNAWFDLRISETVLTIGNIVPSTLTGRFVASNIRIGFNRVVLIKDGDNVNDWKAFINGILSSPSTSSGTSDVLTSYSFGSILSGYRNAGRQVKNLTMVSAGLVTSTPTDTELINFGRDGIIPVFQETINFQEISSFSASTLTSISGKPQIFNGFIDGDEDYRLKESGLPDVIEGLRLTYNNEFIKFPVSLLDNLTSGDYTILFDYYLERPGNYPSGEIIMRSLGATGGDFFIYTLSASELGVGTQTPDAVMQINPQLQISPETVQTIRFSKSGNGFNASPINSNISINSNYKSIQSVAISGATSPDFSTATEFRFTDDCVLFRIAFFESNLSERDIQAWRNNSLLSSKDVERVSCIANYTMNGDELFEDGANVLVGNSLEGSVHGPAQISGFAGAGSVDQLADALTNIVTLKSLR